LIAPLTFFVGGDNRGESLPATHARNEQKFFNALLMLPW
jgi:hypothetical protein